MERRKGLGPTPKVTVGEIMAHWVDAQELKGPDRLRERTLLDYKRDVAAFPDWLKTVRAGSTPEVHHAVTRLVLEYKRRGRDGHLRSADQHRLDRLRMIFHWAANRGHLLLRNPLADLDLPRTKAKRKNLPAKWRDYESINLFRAEALRMAPPYPYVVLMGLYHAPREGEILGVEWPHLDLFADQPAMRIVQDISRYKGEGRPRSEWHFGPPKSDASYRPITLDPEIVSGLFEIQRTQQAARRVLGPAYGVPGHPDRDLVFCHEDGRPIDARAFLRRQFYPLCDRAGMPRIHFHQLRDVWATHFLAKGGSPRDAAGILGHATTKMVLEVYAQQVPEAQRKVSKLVADAIRGRQVGVNEDSIQ